MSQTIRIETPLTQEKLRKLKVGDNVLIDGVIYTGRDAAHKKMVEALERGEDLPFDMKDQIIYFVGPTPAKEGQVIGSAGPTTSGRMDAYSPKLIAKGLTGMIGKGLRSAEVIDAMKKHGAIYFGAIGGAGALIAKRIVSAEVIAYPELGTEAVRRLVVKDFPAMVIIDHEGNNLYDIGKNQYRRA
ncbi:hydro-lyase family enzyme, Fe-S type, tartrate/fumarate subfamily [Desulfosporosinus orientis DSM 765]|uniref:Hydro-lyase family enzyme, Fe-S type, tartrate/fumarate subfamily n=1 Tax=Desulfosporosinus orientis (strain ATCC 19365 / DSM 765 / NCIMB 8382 / VKM B-1628 / Singapore I) TaxID=768706 RepID=G7W9S6_DESOD|nr:Fe-S-containing hydro-lyase [Desulfosporosinus orientis]AET70642.1 hydro-lyase family enzyme, Fe-S type, tartrate/fumarate subfamily [Desulfosporosinus orientis DSM 765]